MIRWFDDLTDRCSRNRAVFAGSRGRALVAAVLTFAGAAAWAGAASGQCQGVCWTPRGAFSGIEFTGLYTVPGYPCIVAWTALQNGGLGLSTDCGQQFGTVILANAHDVTAKNSEIGYVAAGTIGIAKTVDGGGNWFQANQGLPAGADARAIAIHLGVPDTVYAGFYNAGVYKGAPLEDSLIQWTPMNQGLLDNSVRALARVRGGTFFLAATNSGIWRCGATGSWTNVAPGVTANSFVIDASDTNRVYAAGETGLYKSTNGGLSFFPSSVGLPGVPINDVARRTDGLAVYVGTRGQGVYESTDNGASWHPFGPAIPGENDARAVMCVVGATSVDGAQVFVGTRINGLFEATYSTPAVPTTWGQIKDVYRR